MIYNNGRWYAKDFKKYAFGKISDKNFKELYNSRDPKDICE